jgi:hypothetical protein
MEGMERGRRHYTLALEAPGAQGALGCQQLLISRRRGRNVKHGLQLVGPLEAKRGENGHYLQEVLSKVSARQRCSMLLGDTRNGGRSRADTHNGLRGHKAPPPPQHKSSGGLKVCVHTGVPH